MNYSLTEILTFLGSIGLFLYGMKLVSEGLQRIAGDHLRGILSDIKGNKFISVLSGFFSTAIVQSSSATTLMIVSSVNAGLVSLAQSIAVIMGINVGTTVTTWIIAFFGFHLDIFPYLLPIIAIGLPLYNSNKNRWNSIGVLLIGFALMFFAISVMNQSMHTHQTVVFDNPIIFALIGLIGTMIVQASSVTFVVSLILCHCGLLSFEMACAVMVGANVGTCIIPLILSRSANVMAKRAALSHLLFNFFGAVWVFVLFTPLCRILNVGPLEFNLALFHTLFNVVNLCVLVGFTKYFVRLVTKFIPEKEIVSEDTFKLQFISSGLMDSGEIALSQAKQETNNYAGEIYNMFGLIHEMLAEPNGSVKIIALHDRVQKMEDDSDDAEEEIADFLKQINSNTLSTDGDQVSFSIFKMIDDMESIADCIQHMAITIMHKSEQRIIFNNEMKQSLSRMIGLTDSSLLHMSNSIQLEEVSESVLNKAYNYEDEINNFRNQLRNYVLENIDKKQIGFQQGSIYMELVNECEKIGDYVINVLSAMPR